MPDITELFNAHSSGNPARIAKADEEFRFERERIQMRQEYAQRSCVSIMQKHFASGVVSKKVKSPFGYNLYIPREESETKREWTERTQDVANDLRRISPRMIMIDQKTYNNGRLYLDVSPYSDAEALLQIYDTSSDNLAHLSKG